MATVTIDGREYDGDKLSDQAKAQITSLHFVDGELQRLQAQSAVLQTARSAYARALSEILAAADNEKK